MPDSPDPESLDHLLDRWGRNTPRAPGSVAPDVWQRIAQAERPHPVQRWLTSLHAAFARPSFAAAFVAACVLLGLFLAEVRSSRLQADYSGQIAQNYVRLIDPLLLDAEPPRTAKP